MQPANSFTLQRAHRVHIMLLICITACLSTVASVVGGLVMYVQSVAVLEKGVEDLSEREVAWLAAEILHAPEEVERTAMEMKNMFMPVGGTPAVSGGDAKNWSETIRWYSFSRIQNSAAIYGVGIVLVPYESTDPGAFYSQIWADILKDGSREYIFGRYYDGINTTTGVYNPHAVPWVPQQIVCDTLDPKSGARIDFAYNFDYFQSSWTDELNLPLDGDFMKYTNTTGTGGHFLRGPEPFTMHRFRVPWAWHSRDLNPYVYHGYDLFAPPPPAPHPWSGYKQVWFQAYYETSLMERTIARHREENKDATVVLYDGLSDRIYSATSGEKLVDAECLQQRGVDLSISTCSIKLVNMSQKVQDAWRAVGEGVRQQGESSKFSKEDLDGSVHFVRIMTLFTFAPSNGVPNFDLSILWMVPQSVIRSKIDEALIILIAFACAVFVIDLALTAIEVIFVARPLNAIALAMEPLHNLDLHAVTTSLHKVATGPVCIREVHLLCQGMLFACRSLQEYKSFLPTTLFIPGHENTCFDETVNDTYCSTGVGSEEAPRRCEESFSRVRLAMVSCRGTLMRLTLCEECLSPDNFAVILTQVSSAVESRRGVLHGFCLCTPQILHASWNLSSMCAEHSKLSCSAAVHIRSASKEEAPVAISLTKGQYNAGNMGSLGFRGFAVRSEAVAELDFAHEFTKRSVDSIGVPIVVATRDLAYDLAGVFVTHIVGQLNLRSTHIPIYEVSKEAEINIGEWMYELEQIETDTLAPFFGTQTSQMSPLTDSVALSPLQRHVYKMLVEGKGRVYHRCAPYHTEGEDPSTLIHE